MGKEELLKLANEKKPAEFTKEFKRQLDALVHQKLQPEIEVGETDDDNDSGDEGDKGEQE